MTAPRANSGGKPGRNRPSKEPRPHRQTQAQCAPRRQHLDRNPRSWTRAVKSKVNEHDASCGPVFVVQKPIRDLNVPYFPPAFFTPLATSRKDPSCTTSPKLIVKRPLKHRST